MARETVAQRREREAAENRARYEATRIPATIQDTRGITIMARGMFSCIAGKREQLIENLRWHARSLNQEADRLAEDPTRDPSTSNCTGSLSHDIDRLAAEINVMGNMLKSWVRELDREGVKIPGLTVMDGNFGGTLTFNERER